MEKGIQAKHLDLVWLAGLVFTDRDFVKHVDKVGLEEAVKKCPHQDLTRQEMSAFKQAMANPDLRKVVADWWQTYDRVRQSGALVSPAGDHQDPWAPYPYNP